MVEKHLKKNPAFDKRSEEIRKLKEALEKPLKPQDGSNPSEPPTSDTP